MGWFPQTPGGLNRYAYELIQALTPQNHVEYCGIGLPKQQTSPGLHFTNLADDNVPLPLRLHMAQKNFAQRQLQQPDVINLHFALYSFPILHQLPSNVPVVFNFHGPWALESQQEGASRLNVGIKYWLEQQVFRRCDRFIVLSKAFGEILHTHYNISWNKIHIIPGGVDINRFQANLSRQQAREILNWPLDRFILFTPRRLVHRMGLSILLDAIAQIQSECPDVWLAIAGKGNLSLALEQQAAELDINNHVQFLGFLPDELLPIAYQAADLTILPSQSLEGFGLVLVESLACGTPVVCTPIGGMPEVISGLSPELITRTAEAESIATMLADVIHGVIKLPSRNTCRTYADTYFNWSNIAQKVRDVLLTI